MVSPRHDTSWCVVLTDHDPIHGGTTEVLRGGTRREAVWYAEREVSAARELGFRFPVTFKIRRVTP